jgi:hypothetical protein
MKISCRVLFATALLTLVACGKGKVEQCNAFVDRANQAQTVINKLKLDSEDAAQLEKGAASIETEAKAFGALELKDEKLVGYRSEYAATLVALGKIMHDLATLQRDSKEPSKAEGLEAQVKKIDAEADKVTKTESDVVDQVNVYCTGSK